MRLLIGSLLVCLALSAGTHTMMGRSDWPKEYDYISRAHPSQEVKVMFALYQQNVDTLEAEFFAISDPDHPSYGQFMTQEEILAIIAPSEAVQNEVRQLLLNASVEPENIRMLGDAVEAKMTVAVIESLFSTQMHNFVCKESGRVITRQMGAMFIPEAVNSYVEFVSGLTEFPMPNRIHVAHADATDANVVPQTINELYKVNGVTADSHSSQGVIEFQDDASFAASDMAMFYQEMSITTTNVTNVIGPFSGTYPDTEATLDIQYVSAVGINAVNWYWTAENWMYDFAVNFFATKKVPMVFSMSWGWSEVAQCTVQPTTCSTLGIDSETYVKRSNVEFMKIGARGTTVIAASGDSGANGRTDPTCTDSVLHPGYPAASPYITAVGATQLDNPQTNLKNAPPACSGELCASGGDEVSVSFDLAGFTSGGGFSVYSPMPSYQKDAVSAYLKKSSALPPSSYFNATGRAYPDIAALGHNFLIYIYGSQTPVGGTSASAPTIAGIVAILNSVRIANGQTAIGFANPFLYKMFAEHPAAYNDITVGDNSCTESGCSSSCVGFKATEGWDAVSGLGTPNVEEMINYIKTQSRVQQ